MTLNELVEAIERPNFWQNLARAADAARKPGGNVNHAAIAAELDLPETIAAALLAGHVAGRRSITSAAEAVACDAEGRLLVYLRGERIAIELGAERLAELGQQALAVARMLGGATTGKH